MFELLKYRLESLLREIIIALVVIIVAVGIFMATIDRTVAHEWYHLYCCNNKDCAEVTEMKKDPTRPGWLMTTKHAKDVFVPFNFSADRSYASEDGKVHLCVGRHDEFHHPDGRPTDKFHPRCVYWPVS